jgi:hypothetical protein
MDERRYRAYITDAQKLIAENIAKAFGGSIISKSWIDYYIPQDERTGDEIAKDVFLRAGLKLKGGES